LLVEGLAKTGAAAAICAGSVLVSAMPEAAPALGWILNESPALSVPLRLMFTPKAETGKVVPAAKVDVAPVVWSRTV